jgi:hypothetical protein
VKQNDVSASIPSDVLSWYTDLVRRLVGIRRPAAVAADNERTFHLLDLSPDARSRIIRYARDVEGRIRSGLFQAYPAFGAKLAGHAVRLAGAIHLMSHPEPQLGKFSDESLSAGIAWAEFFRAHAEVAFTPEASEGIAYAQRIYDWMTRYRPDIFKERDAQRGIGSSRHSIAQVRAGIDELERGNYLRKYIVCGKAIVIVNPTAFSIAAPIAHGALSEREWR